MEGADWKGRAPEETEDRKSRPDARRAAGSPSYGEFLRRFELKAPRGTTWGPRGQKPLKTD